MPESNSSALHDQLKLAAQVQNSLLPLSGCRFPGWMVQFDYEPAGVVSGDYLDLIPGTEGSFYFVLGDVAGKGIAASMLMSHLHATLRAFLSLGMPLEDVLTRASRMFCEINSPVQFATLVLGRATAHGDVEICNAGHVPVLLVASSKLEKVESGAMPVGLFCNQTFTSTHIKVEPADILFLYSDGLTEAANEADQLYGEDRLLQVLSRMRGTDLNTVLSSVLQDVKSFSSGELQDDRSVLLLQRL